MSPRNRLNLAIILTITLVLILFMTFSSKPQPPRFYGAARVGGNFTLTDMYGRTLQDGNFRGHPMIVYMGYTNCPDICPATLASISAALKQLGEGGNQVWALFITLDPVRDTPAQLTAYLKNFDPRILGLTGSKQAIQVVERDYKIVSSMGKQANGGYLINHSGYIYIMGKDGKYVTHLNYDAKPDLIAATLRPLL